MLLAIAVLAVTSAFNLQPATVLRARRPSESKDRGLTKRSVVMLTSKFDNATVSRAPLPAMKVEAAKADETLSILDRPLIDPWSPTEGCSVDTPSGCVPGPQSDTSPTDPASQLPSVTVVMAAFAPPADA